MVMEKGNAKAKEYKQSNDMKPLGILIDGRGDPNAVDTEGVTLPTLIRVSSEISNGSIILNVDCDMYANNSELVRDAVCFFMDEENGHEIAYVQFPQNYNNMTKNNLYGTSMKIIPEMATIKMWIFLDWMAMEDLCTWALDVFTGESLSGKKYNKQNKEKWESIPIGRKVDESSHDSEERIKGLATCTYEENTQWGNEMGLKYGCPVEDVITGLSIQCRGWKSVYFNPVRKGFLGLAPTSLAQSLVQHKRWSEGDFQILTSKFCPFIYGHGKIKLALQMGYGIYCFWALNSFPTLFYVIFPSLCLYKGISLFPSIYSPWFLPFMYVIIAEYAYNILESLWHGMTLKGWWNEQRMWLLKRTTSYLFAFVDTLLLLSGIAKSAFIITAKVSDDDVSQRYEQEIMEFGSSSPMFTILASLAMLNLFCLIGGATRVMMDGGISVLETLMLQFLLCGSLVLINVPFYQGLFFRKDKGRLPTSLAITSVVVAVLACLISIY
ncbi:cellulose synthase-like protein E6 [Magnolia sinica]|uniref:cellulose synthase-like protein E6 n=1 Tax=Magnolia sinica TaxID=86752 RepID=UPI0026590B8C|nr:cellulose synthase-like protein E6 [Magnolia sinica]